MTETVRALNAAMVVVLCLVLLGGLYVQVVDGEVPCPLCYLQRLGMMGIAVGAFLNVTCGLRPAHYGLSILAALFGSGVALRQIALHACPQFSTFGEPVWGLSLYTWSFIVHTCAVFAIAWFLFLQEDASWGRRDRRLNWWEIVSAVFLIFVVVANVVTTMVQCGSSVC